jgi:hypothetical protein
MANLHMQLLFSHEMPGKGVPCSAETVWVAELALIGSVMIQYLSYPKYVLSK